MRRSDQARPEVDADAVEIVEDPGLVGHEQEVVRALDAAEGRRVVDERGQETEHEHGARERESDGDPLLPRGQSAAGVSEHRPAASGGQAAKRTRPIVKAAAEPTPGLSHSARNQAQPAAARRGPRALPRRLPQKTRPQASSAQPAPSRATAPSSDAPANENAGSSRAIASE